MYLVWWKYQSDIYFSFVLTPHFVLGVIPNLCKIDEKLRTKNNNLGIYIIIVQFYNYILDLSCLGHFMLYKAVLQVGYHTPEK